MPKVRNYKTKAFANHFCIVFITLTENRVRTNKQLINLLYNDVKNLTSILSWCIGPKCVF